MLPLLLGCRPAPPLDEPMRAVIVVLDGARVDETTEETDDSLADPALLLPAVRTLLQREGLLLSGALNTGVPITTESHIELLTGRRQPVATFPPGQLGAWRSDTPTLFEALQASRDLSSEQLAVLVNTVLIEETMSSRHPATGQQPRPYYALLAEDGELLSDTGVLDQVRVYLDQNDTHLLLANLHQIDLIAHDGGDYPGAIAAVDDGLVALWDFIQSTPPYADHTWLVLLADHGRHRGERWDNHGDQCSGCRQVPLMVLGPGVTAAEDDAPVTLADLSVTLAGLLDTALPHATGRPIDALLPDTAPTGPRQLTVDAGRRAWSDDGIWLSGRQRADPDALHAEAPTLRGDLLCWRELLVDALREGHASWTARCVSWRGSTWQPLPLPEPTVSPFWRPSIQQDDRGRHWMLDSTNPDGVTGASAVHPRLRVWDEVIWRTTLGPELSYPLHPDLLLLGETAMVAVGYSAEESRGRDTRQIGVWSVRDGEWRALPPLRAEGFARLEHPALHADGDEVRIAALAWLAEGGVGVMTARLRGEDFTPPILQSTAAVYPHIPPLWTRDGALVWAEQAEDGTVAVCRDGECAATGLTTVDSIAVDGEEIWMSALVDSAWRILPAPAPLHVEP